MDGIQITTDAPSDRGFLRDMVAMATVPTYPDLALLGRSDLRERLDCLFSRLYEHPERRLWIARTATNQAVGVVWGQFSHHPVTDRDEWVVMLLAVLPEWRGQGLGRRLMERVRHEAEEQGVPVLRLFVSGANTEARGLYRSLGYVDQTIEVTLDLSAPTP